MVCVQSFHSRQGKAYLFNAVVNVLEGPKEERLMTTGKHECHSALLSSCGARPACAPCCSEVSSESVGTWQSCSAYLIMFVPGLVVWPGTQTLGSLHPAYAPQ